MVNPYQLQLDRILGGLYVDPAQTRITLLADGSETPCQPDTLRPLLTNLIYQHFYCEGDSACHADNDAPTESFADELSRHNHTRPQFNNGWSVTDTDAAGLVYAAKGNDRQLLQAGEYVHGQPRRGPVQTGDTVRLLLPTEDRTSGSGFYYVFGQTPGTDSMVLQTRLYFHTLPEGSKALVSWVTQTLNAFRVPFQFKCLNHPDLYGRCDSAVLYVQKPHLMLIFALLSDFLPRLTPNLLPAVPLFTRLLVPGIAFAESPPNPNESFGTSRCGLIAEGITTAVRAGKPASDWATSVRAVFEQLGLSLQHPYRNPTGQPHSLGYPYQFPDYALN